LQAKRLVESFEGLNSCLAQSPGELWSCKVAGKQWLMRSSKYEDLVHQQRTWWNPN